MARRKETGGAAGNAGQVHDDTAEALEARGLYRRAAARWTLMMAQVETDAQRAWLKRRRDGCLETVKKPTLRAADFKDVQAAATETLHRMGLTQAPGAVFRTLARQVRG